MTQHVPYKAPDFDLAGSDGKRHRLEDYRGKWLVVYFYPKDDTPGCTIEACSIRDFYDSLTDLGAVVLGISKDDEKSHQKFAKKHNLNFVLLSDVEGITIDSYGAWGKKMFGREGILRKTFIINPDGEVVKVYGRVTPVGHGEQIASDLKSLQQSSEA